MKLTEIRERIDKEGPSQEILDQLNALSHELIMHPDFFHDAYMKESHAMCGELFQEVFAKINGAIFESVHRNKLKEFIKSKQKIGYTIKQLSSRGESDYVSITMVKA